MDEPLNVNDLTDKEYEEHVRKTLEAVDAAEAKPKLGKITLTFKTPDVCDQICCRYPKSSFTEEQQEEIREKLTKWIEYGEYIEIEFDLDKDTAAVKEKS